MNKTNLIVYKPNELIEIVNRPISAIGLKVYNSILQKLQDLGTDRMTIPLNEIIIDNSKNYEDIYSYLDELQKVQVKSIDKRGKSWGSFVLLSEYKKTDKGIFVAVPPSIHNALCGKDKKQEDLYYTAIKLLEEKSFKCSYSLIFYEIFKKYEKVSIPVYTIEDLRQMTKTEDKYKVYADFKKRIIVPALKEINSFDTKYIYDYEEEYLGRKVYKIKFTKVLKESEKPQLVLPDLSEKLLSAIEKSKKNRFIQEKFSQKAVDKAVTQFGEELVIAGLIKLYSFEGKVSYFSRLLNSTIKDIQRDEEVNNLLKEKTIKKEEVITPAPAVPKDELNDFDRFKSKILGQAHNQLSETDWKKLILELYKAKTKDMVEEILKKYDLEINLTLI